LRKTPQTPSFCIINDDKSSLSACPSFTRRRGMTGTIRLQLPTESYLRMRTGRMPAAEWDARTVNCRECGKDMWASSLGRHLADQHQIYQQQVVAEELLNRREGAV